MLLVDLDPQGALSAGLGIAAARAGPHDLQPDAVAGDPDDRRADAAPAIEGVDLIPANIDLSAAEVQLINEVGREHTLARALRPVLHAYDYVLIDCQPSLGLLTVNALACAHGVIIPLAAEFFSLRGVALLVDTISKVQERINPDLSVRRRAGHHVRRAHRARPGGRRRCCTSGSATRSSTRSSLAP